jgi:hypothetical protein
MCTIATPAPASETHKKKKMLVFTTTTTVHVRGPIGKKKLQLCAHLS